nr:acyltransferase [Pseudidiomarina insulisalsae]
MKIYYNFYVITRTLSLFKLPGFRIIRRWAYEKAFRTSNLSIGDNVYIVTPHLNPKGSKVIFEPFVELGSHSYLDYSGSIEIKANSTVSEGVKIYTHNHSVDGKKDWRRNEIVFSKLLIEENCWIGAGSIITASVTRIGAGAIIGAGSVVTKNVLPNSVVAGNPAKLIRMRKCR